MVVQASLKYTPRFDAYIYTRTDAVHSPHAPRSDGVPLSRAPSRARRTAGSSNTRLVSTPKYTPVLTQCIPRMHYALTVCLAPALRRAAGSCWLYCSLLLRALLYGDR
jgi:hypothetical protein